VAACASTLERGLLPRLLRPGARPCRLPLASKAAIEGCVLLVSAYGVLAAEERGAAALAVAEAASSAAATTTAAGPPAATGGGGAEAAAAPLALCKAAAAALLLALGAEDLLARGETAALRHAGSAWLQLGRLAAQLLAAERAGISMGGASSNNGGGHSADSSSAGGEGGAGGDGNERAGRDLWPRGLPAPHSGLAHSAAALWAAVGGALVAAAAETPAGGASEGDARRRQEQRQPQRQRDSDAPTAEAWQLIARQSPWLPGPAPAQPPAAALRAAAAHACARARALLSHCFGPAHAAAEAAAFAPLFSGGLPYAEGAALVAEASRLHDEAAAGSALAL
jgi:hypothetical protein